MSALGLMIMIVAGAVTLDVILENTRNTDASVVGQTVANVDLGGFFTAGVLVGVAFMLGLMLLLAGLRRANRKRLERRELARSYEGTAAHAETLQEERDRLAAELEQERMARTHAEQAGRHASRPERRTEPQATERVGAASGSTAEAGVAEGRSADTHRIDAPAGDATAAPGTPGAPVYPNEPAAGATPVGTASTEHSKPSLKDRLLGR